MTHRYKGWLSTNTPPPPESHNRPIPIYLNSCLAARLGGIKQKKSSWGSVMNDTFFFWNKFTKASIFVSVCCWGIECFHSRGQHLCKCFVTKEIICIRKEFISHRTNLGHKHGRCFIVLGHQYGWRDVMWKHSIQWCTSPPLLPHPVATNLKLFSLENWSVFHNWYPFLGQKPLISIPYRSLHCFIKPLPFRLEHKHCTCSIAVP